MAWLWGLGGWFSFVFLSPFFLSFFLSLVRITLNAIMYFHYNFPPPPPHFFFRPSEGAASTHTLQVEGYGVIYILLRGGEGDWGEFYIFRPGLFISLGNLLCEEGGRGGLFLFFHHTFLSLRTTGIAAPPRTPIWTCSGCAHKITKL
jgi:hypothetical protein